MSSVRGWLRKKPPAVAVRVTCADDDETVKVVKVNKADPRCWARCEETIAALQPAMMEALDKDGDVLRAHKFEVPDDPDADDDDEKEKKKGSKSEYVEISKIIAAAHRDGAAINAEAYKASFNMMEEITKAAANAHLASAKAINSLAARLSRVQPVAGENADGDGMEGFMKAAAMRMMGLNQSAGGAQAAGGGVAEAMSGIDPDQFSDDELQMIKQSVEGVLKTRAGKKNGHTNGAPKK